MVRTHIRSKTSLLPVGNGHYYLLCIRNYNDIPVVEIQQDKTSTAH